MKADYTILQGDCRERLKELPAASVHCVVTSPPYHGLRRYKGVEPSVWGRLPDEPCAPHYAPDPHRQHEWGDDGHCKHNCGAWKGLLGLEPTIDAYVKNIVECFRAVKRVLRDDGTLWLNLGDSYSQGKMGRDDYGDTTSTLNNAKQGSGKTGVKHSMPTQQRKALGFAPKNLIGQPWRIAFALQADGWFLRSDIIWHKPNPLPESVTDRPTRAHEYLFLLTKQPKYYYDAEAVREKHAETKWSLAGAAAGIDVHDGAVRGREDGKITGRPTYASPTRRYNLAGRNKRTVWTIPTEALPEAHFAAFPRKLVLPCVLAGTSEKGCCPECGTPWLRIVDKDRQPTRPARDNKQDATGMANRDHARHVTDVKTLGWKPGCECTNAEGMSYTMHDGTSGNVPVPPNPVPCTVLDCYCGSGTTGVVATQQGRRFIGIDASAEYCEMARRRIADPEPEVEAPDAPGQMTFEEVTQ